MNEGLVKCSCADTCLSSDCPHIVPHVHKGITCDVSCPMDGEAKCEAIAYEFIEENEMEV